MSKVKIINLVEAIQTTSQELEADYKAYVGLAASKRSVHMIEARLANLETSFKEARLLHQKIVGFPSEDAKTEYMEALTFHKLKELFFNYSSELKEQLAATDIQGCLNNSVAASKSPSAELKLPAMKLPTFDGSLQMWPEFKGLFEGMVNKNASISDAHKLQYLKSNLTGEAARMLRNTETNFESAWALLVKRFQNVRLLKDSQFKLLFDQPKLTQESSDDLKLLLDTTNEAKQSLKSLGVPVESWEDVLIFHTVQKLSSITRGLWESHISTYVDYPTFNTLEDFILMRSRTLDVIGQSSPSSTQTKAKRQTINTIRVHNSTIQRCSLCQGSHSIRHCFKFKALIARKRQEVVKKKKLCFNCLSSAHFTQNCTSTFTCSVCHQKHHSLLHMNESVNAMHANETAPMGAGTPPFQPTSSSTQIHQSVPSNSIISSYGTASAYNTFVAETNRAPVLLATALIKVPTTTGQLLTLRALLDPGSEASFITEAAVQLLKLKRERSCVKILGVGETNTTTSNHQVSLTIFSNVNKTFSLRLNALILPKLTAALPTHFIPWAHWSHLYNIQFADPTFDKPSKIDILLGSDIYPSILLEGLRKGEPGTPMAQRTELGWVLSGGISPKHQSNVTSLHITTEGQPLDNVLLKFWELEEVPRRKLLSPEEELLASIPEIDREVKVPLSFDAGNEIKTLGIQWHPAKDTFTSKISLQDSRKTTKRTILSDIARLYDPMGWISPCIIVGKILMQDIWKEKQTWDSELPPTLVTAWHNLKTELTALNNIVIPRWVHLTTDSRIEIHGFCDASEKAYAAALYLRVTTRDTNVTNLLVSKTRVAPLKIKSLARLELCGAQLLAHLLIQTIKTMDLQSPKIFAWCDSQITLTWIKTAPYIRTTFVANRVAEIQELIDPACWNYVRSKDNPADVASRGLFPRELLINNQWWHGPEFLLSFDEQSQPPFDVTQTNLETKASEIGKPKNEFIKSGYPINNVFHLCVHFTAFETNDLFTRFSSLPRLLRATAYWLRFFTNLRRTAQKMSTRVSGPLSVDEIRSARIRLITIAQQQFFADEIAMMTKGRTVSKGSKLTRLSPFIDEKGVLRVGGRLENADLPYAQRHPIILPAQNFLTSLIVHNTHLTTLHGGQQLMMATLRSEYWILQLKSAVKKCIYNCLKCYRYKATEMQQQMGNLPALRVNQARPFQTSGVDYAGPVQLKAWKGRCNKITKAYIAIFVCFCTKAVHLELVSDYTTSAFLAAFKRFTARRGICTNIYSDCGTNFRGAANILETETLHTSKHWTEEIAQRMQANGTTWHFNPPAAPHFGGLWEAGVKSMKHHLKRVIGHYSLTFEEYATVLAQVEACLNSRPLCPITEDPEDLSILTPGHFLTGAPLNIVPERDLTESKSNHLDRWQLMQKIQQDFWRKWRSEYLVRLQQRPKWLTPNAELKIGQLVLLPDEQMPPTLWRLGRITATHPGADDKIRVVTIKTATTSLKRPIAKLCLLPMLNE